MPHKVLDVEICFTDNNISGVDTISKVQGHLFRLIAGNFN